MLATQIITFLWASASASAIGLPQQNEHMNLIRHDAAANPSEAPAAGHVHSFVSKTPYGVDETPNFSFNHLYNLSTKFFDAFMYPNNAIEAKKINSTFFAENVLGRVDVTRNFNGRELNTEYAFGLFSGIASNPGEFTLLGIPQHYDITHFIANQNIVSLAAIVDFNITALNVVNPVEVDFWATFNSKGEISQYDATFRYLQWQFDTLSMIGQKKYNLNTTAQIEYLTTQALANSICNTAQASCTGVNQQYTSKDDCMKFLTQEIRFGQAYELGMNTLLCRMVHQNMVPLRPSVHCSHIGRSGGGYCDDERTYAGTVREPLFKNAPFIPYGLAPKGNVSQE